MQKKYGLFTAIAMIIGTVIGSGIFFKSDNILIYTNGSIFLGVLVFAIASIGIIFGSLAIGELSSKTNRVGGLIAYFEEFIGKKTACAIGWFQSFIYYPALIAVVSWAVGIYTCILLNLEQTLELQVLIGACYMVFSYFINTISPKLGGVFQNAATVIKLIPLVFIAVCGLIFGNTSDLLTSPLPFQGLESSLWLSALGPIAFSFDGWVVASSISHEIKNAKRNLPIAYTVAPIFILIIYVLYFVGISIYVGPEQIIALGDAHVSFAASKLLSGFGAKIVLIFVVISVMGTVNGIVLGSIRMPYSLSVRGMFFKSLLPTLDAKLSSAITAFLCSCVWTALNYISQRYKFFGHSDISEGFVVISYAIYIILYVKVLLLYKSGKITGFFKGVVSPIFATVGSVIILYSGLKSSAFYFYAISSIVIIAVSLLFFSKK